MEPPKIVREADPQEGRGCWMGCFGIGCLLVVIAFFGLIVGGWYTVFYTKLPLVLLEKAIEEDGKVKIEGLTGSISKGLHIDELKFLTVDDEHWSELRGITFDYNGFVNMTSTGSVLIDRMTVDSGTIYAEVESPDDFMFDANDLNFFDDLEDSDLSEFRVNLLQVNNLKIINLDTDYSIEIESVLLRDFVAQGENGIAELGQLEIKSNMLEMTTEAGTRWPDSASAKVIRGTLQSKFSERMKQNIDFSLDLDFGDNGGRRAIAMFDNRWVQEFSPQSRTIRLADFSPNDYFTSGQILPSQIQLTATFDLPESKARDRSGPPPADEETVWTVSPGASFRLGQTTFQIESVAGNRAPLRSIIGKASVNGETIEADLRCRNYFQKGRIELTVDDQPADRTDWSHVIYGADFDSLDRDDQRTLEATIEAWRSKSEDDKPSRNPTGDEPKAEAESTAEESPAPTETAPK